MTLPHNNGGESALLAQTASSVRIITCSFTAAQYPKVGEGRITVTP